MAVSDAIFIHGILQRSGTNFLSQLLRVHPEVVGARGEIYEDRFLENSDDLLRFVESVRARWGPEWKVPEDVDDQLLGCIGDGLISFLSGEPEKRLVVKNPRVRHLGRFFSLFPTSRLIILLRDGRSVVHSGIASFGGDLELWARRWADAADEIAEFSRTSGQDPRVLVVRYEDLVTDLRPQLERILDFCGLDRSSFDFARAARSPVYGSSEYFGPEHTAAAYRPVERDETFDPLRRWRDWPSAMHDEFWAVAGAQMHTLGYTEDAPSRRL